MATTTPKGFKVWNLETDPFDHDELAANWNLLDTLLDTPPRKVRLVTTLTPGTGGPLNPPVAGDLVMTSATVSTFEPFTLLRYNGTNWHTINGVEIKATVPLADNWAGRLVLLTGADNGFAAGDLIRNTNGGNVIGSWVLVSPLANYNVGGISGLQATGDIYFSNSVRGPVLVDRITGTKYRLYFSSGGLYSEVVT